MAVTGHNEPLFSWKRISFFLIGTLVIVFIYNAIPHTTTNIASPGSTDGRIPGNVSARFDNVTADNDDIDGLTDAQCGAIFPDLYTEIDRAVWYWNARGHVITPEDIEIKPDQAAMRILIHNNELRILESWHSVDPKGAAPDRAMGVLYLIQRALDSAIAAGDRLPAVEVALNFQDETPLGAGTHAFWTFARNVSDEAHQQFWLMPNFDFWYYGATGHFQESKLRAIHYDAPFTEKIPKIVWRGNSNFGQEIRGALLKVTEGKDWADVVHVGDHHNPAAMRVDQFCKYAMTVYTEGVSYSGRLKHLMNCKSLLFVHDIGYATHYSHLLEKEGPNQNYINVKRDFSDLEAKVQWYLDNPAEAERIIANALKTFRSRYNTRSALSCYIRRLIQAWSSVAFTPVVDVPMRDGEGVSPRGFSFAQFLYEPQDTNLEKYNGLFTES